MESTAATREVVDADRKAFDEYFEMVKHDQSAAGDWFAVLMEEGIYGWSSRSAGILLMRAIARLVELDCNPPEIPLGIFRGAPTWYTGDGTALETRVKELVERLRARLATGEQIHR